MSILALVLQLGSAILLAAAMLRPALRGRCALWMGLCALACLVTAALGGDGTRQLEISHLITAFDQNNPGLRASPVETIEAPAWHWPLAAGLFCLAWAGWAFACRGAGPSRALGAPLLLAWTGAALQLGLEKAAAPGILLQPFDFAPDRFVLPAAFAGTILLARPERRIFEFALYTSLLVAALRLPLVVFATLATQNRWGTHLDVHGTTVYIPGGNLKHGYAERAPGSTEQLFDLVWAPQILLIPVVYFLSAGGVGFLALMARRQTLANQGLLE